MRAPDHGSFIASARQVAGGSQPIVYLFAMRRLIRLGIAVWALIGALNIVSSAGAEEQVDVALVIAVDVSRSMSPEELLIQRKGYAAAIASRDVVRAIELGPYGRIGLMMFEWANESHAREIVGWTVIESQADALAFAEQVLADSTYGQRRTSISGAIRSATAFLEDVPYVASRRVIDISGDGPNNQGFPVTQARDAAIERGLIINGLPLMTTGGAGFQFNIKDLDVYYRRCVIGGPASFVIPVNDWAQFPEAVRRKLILEIGGRVPEKAKVIPAQFTFEEPYDCLVGEKIWQQMREQYYWDQ
ncbi:DUF1194 domain-containing protein [Roseibium salinum]|uniref:DUF1194 domain-containing protein n=2 Tax=Roseibium salinum TaxID=1604349 RepID=A0ABT3R269_9HYPH|nr:DUF1194 domain-containing protein [Roseibium sp. DSM 29163]MCX2723257.1 DUF1194 domain-containing protein [Roseibium sp. DSM 29163]